MNPLIKDKIKGVISNKWIDRLVEKNKLEYLTEMFASAIEVNYTKKPYK